MQLYQPLQPPKLENQILDTNYRYREFTPSKNLEEYVSCYWTIDYRASETSKLHRIIPDACVDIIFDLRSSSFSKAAFVTGLMTTFEVVNLTHHYSLFGIRFFAETLHYFLKYPAGVFSEDHVFLEEILGDGITLTVEEIVTSVGLSKVIETVEKELMKCLLKNESKVNNLLKISIQKMYEDQGNLSIRSLAEKLNYSERNIRRTFQKELGVSSKEFLNIIRFQSLLHEIYRGSKLRFTDLAPKFGYYDQSHFIHHFKRYYGKLPTQIG